MKIKASFLESGRLIFYVDNINFSHLIRNLQYVNL